MTKLDFLRVTHLWFTTKKHREFVNITGDVEDCLHNSWNPWCSSVIRSESVGHSGREMDTPFI